MLSDDDPLLTRSSSGIARTPQEACPAERAAVIDCRARLGLKERECYPRDYRGECDDLELRLKKCLAFALCGAKDASAIYDASRPRAERLEANRRVQECLARRRAIAPCVPRNSAFTQHHAFARPPAG